MRWERKDSKPSQDLVKELFYSVWCVCCGNQDARRKWNLMLSMPSLSFYQSFRRKVWTWPVKPRRTRLSDRFIANSAPVRHYAKKLKPERGSLSWGENGLSVNARPKQNPGNIYRLLREQDLIYCLIWLRDYRNVLLDEMATSISVITIRRT